MLRWLFRRKPGAMAAIPAGQRIHYGEDTATYGVTDQAKSGCKHCWHGMEIVSEACTERAGHGPYLPNQLVKVAMVCCHCGNKEPRLLFIWRFK